jgi:hypothetical protein
MFVGNERSKILDSIPRIFHELCRLGVKDCYTPQKARRVVGGHNNGCLKLYSSGGASHCKMWGSTVEKTLRCCTHSAIPQVSAASAVSETWLTTGKIQQAKFLHSSNQHAIGKSPTRRLQFKSLLATPPALLRQRLRRLPPPPTLFIPYASWLGLQSTTKRRLQWFSTTGFTTEQPPPLPTIYDSKATEASLSMMMMMMETAPPRGDTTTTDGHRRSAWNAALQRALQLRSNDSNAKNESVQLLPSSWKARVDASAANSTSKSSDSSAAAAAFMPHNNGNNDDDENNMDNYTEFDLYTVSSSDSRATASSSSSSTTLHTEPFTESPHYNAEQQWKLDTTIRLLNAQTDEPLGNGSGWSMEDWFVVEDLLVHYWSKQDTIQAVIVQFALLEQCLRERNRLSRPLQPTCHTAHASLYPMGATATPTDGNVAGQTLDSLESLRKQIDRWLHLHLLNDMVESWRLVYTVHADTLAACGFTPTDLLHRVVHTLHHALGLSLDAKTFYYIAEAEMCRPSRHSSPEFVQAVLMQTIDLYRSQPETLASCFPKVPLWNFALTAWVKADRGVEAQTAVTQLLQLMDEYNVPRSKRTYLTALQACVQQKSVNGALQAEQLLQRMYQEYLHSDNGHGGPSPKLQPDVYAFTAVVDAWAKSRSPQAGPRAEQIYQQMLALRHKNHLFGYRKADTTLINCALMCYANPKPTPESVAQAEAFWRQSLVPPDVITYATLIQLYASTANIAAAERLWHELWDTAVDISGHPLVVTEVSLFATMLAMYAKSKLSNRVELAAAVLQRMKESKHVQPNTMVYNGTFYLSSTTGSSRTNTHIASLRS